MRRLLERRNGPAIRDCVIWFALIVGSGIAGGVLWGTGWAIIPFFIYGMLYASTADSRWHEAGHGTAFKSDWLNNTLYEIASFMVMRELTVWRWSHTRHHSDAIIVGRDPEITVPRPPNLTAMILNLFNPPAYPRYFCQLFLHATGRMSAEEKTYIPTSEFPKIYFKARIHLAVYGAIISMAVGLHSLVPLMYVGLPHLYGSWLMSVYGLTREPMRISNLILRFPLPSLKTGGMA